MTQSRLVGAVVFAALCFVESGSLRGAAPRFGVPEVGAGRVTLRLSGDAGARYRVEGSTNLASWFAVGSGVAGADGLLTVEHHGAGVFPWVAYRGLLDGAGKPFPTVQPVVSSNLVASVVAVPEQETVLQFQTPDLVTYTVRLPTHSFAAPTLVTLAAVSGVGGFPTQAGLLAGVRLEPAGVMPLAPFFLQIDFPEPLDARRVSSFAWDHDGTRLHLVPDVVIADVATNRVRILVNQLRSYGCGLVTSGELEALAGTVPPARLRPSRPALHATLDECYPDDAREAKAMQEELEDAIRPRQQEAAAMLGRERQAELLGATDDEGSNALRRVMASEAEFYQREVEPRIAGATASCAKTTTLSSWVLGHQRGVALLGGETGPSDQAALQHLFCEGAQRCQQQAIQCCQTQGGDTRLVQALLGIERQRQLLGAGPECGEISVDQTLQECAPDWYGTLTVRLQGRYLQFETNGSWRIRRTEELDLVLTASVLSAKVRRNAASLFAPATTNITAVLGGELVASDRQEKLEQMGSVCGGRPAELRRDVWSSSLHTNLTHIALDAVLLAPGSGGLFVTPYVRVTGHGTRDMRWVWVTEQSRRSEFDDEDCVTETNTGGSYEDDAGQFDTSFMAKEGEFTYNADSIRYTYDRPEEMQWDFEHFFQGTKTIQLDLHRVR